MAKNGGNKSETAVSRGRGRPPKPSTEVALAGEWGEPGANVSHCDTFEVLPELEGQLAEEIRQFRHLEKEAAWRGLRIGVLILKAHQDVPHGQFIRWLKVHVPFARCTSWRFVTIAERFLADSRLTLAEAYESLGPQALIAAPAAGAAGKPSRPVQLAFDFVGDRSFRDLCDALGINLAGGKRGGDHGGGKARHDLTPAERRERAGHVAAHDWATIESDLSRWLAAKGWQHLDNLGLDRVRRALETALTLIPEPTFRMEMNAGGEVRGASPRTSPPPCSQEHLP